MAKSAVTAHRADAMLDDAQPPTPAPPVGARYVGDGAYLSGVPGRDLSADEWAALAPEQQHTALALGLYILATT